MNTYLTALTEYFSQSTIDDAMSEILAVYNMGRSPRECAIELVLMGWDLVEEAA